MEIISTKYVVKKVFLFLEKKRKKKEKKQNKETNFFKRKIISKCADM